MAKDKNSDYPKSFKKGDVVRAANSLAQEHALRFEGFKPGGRVTASTPAGATGTSVSVNTDTTATPSSK